MTPLVRYAAARRLPSVSVASVTVPVSSHAVRERVVVPAQEEADRPDRQGQSLRGVGDPRRGGELPPYLGRLAGRDGDRHELGQSAPVEPDRSVRTPPVVPGQAGQRGRWHHGTEAGEERHQVRHDPLAHP